MPDLQTVTLILEVGVGALITWNNHVTSKLQDALTDIETLVNRVSKNIEDDIQETTRINYEMSQILRT